MKSVNDDYVYYILKGAHTPYGTVIKFYTIYKYVRKLQISHFLFYRIFFQTPTFLSLHTYIDVV